VLPTVVKNTMCKSKDELLQILSVNTIFTFVCSPYFVIDLFYWWSLKIRNDITLRAYAYDSGIFIKFGIIVCRSDFNRDI